MKRVLLALAVLFSISSIPSRLHSQSKSSAAQDEFTEVIHTAGAPDAAVKVTYPAHDAPRLVFSSAHTGAVLTTIVLGQPYPEDFKRRSDPDPLGLTPKARFRALHISGLPDPIVVAIVMAPGGSDCLYAPTVASAVSGQFRSLLGNKDVTFGSQDGFALGDLGPANGIGFAVWNFEWGDQESHYSAHRYTVRIFRWDDSTKTFRAKKAFKSKKYSDSREAAREAGIPSESVFDVRKLVLWWPEFDC